MCQCAYLCVCACLLERDELEIKITQIRIKKLPFVKTVKFVTEFFPDVNQF